MKTSKKKFKKHLIENCVKDLSYPSETDAPFEVLTQENIEYIDFDVFFSKLTKIEEWHGEEEKRTVEQFKQLENYLVKNLTNLQVCKIGLIEKFIIIGGRDRQGKEFYITTRAVET
ncbi:MAG TPA: nuclease A inhibitor family protein [Pyrinomonadaceae bacterium]|jgi:chromosomal replication initiation ATPase DnaA